MGCVFERVQHSLGILTLGAQGNCPCCPPLPHPLSVALLLRISSWYIVLLLLNLCILLASPKPSVTSTTAYDPAPLSLVAGAVTVAVSTLLVTGK